MRIIKPINNLLPFFNRHGSIKTDILISENSSILFDDLIQCKKKKKETKHSIVSGDRARKISFEHFIFLGRSVEIIGILWKRLKTPK